MEDTIYGWNTFGGLLLNVSQSCDRMLLQCTFGGYKFNCSQIFHQVLRDEGLCCTFNSLDPVFQFVNGSKAFGFNVKYPPEFKPVAWSLENGYEQPLPKYYYPMRAVGIGQSLGLNIILNVESDEYYCSSGNSIGFKIAVHDPHEEPTVHETGVLLSAGFETVVRITPRKLISADKLRQLDVKRRNCIFENEYNLTFFAHYTADNCIYDCIVENMRSRCGCEPFYLTSNNSKLAICTQKHSDCFVNIKASGTCDKCWPNCVWKRYSTSTYSAKLENTGIDINSPILSNMSIAYVQDNIAIAKFYFKQGVYECTKQAPYFGSIDVLSSIGGLISIFFGFSFISLAEFIYYICMRPLRSMISEKRSEKEVFLRKPCLRLANRPKTRFVNPYKQPSYKLKTQQSLALPRKVWHINAGNLSLPNQNGEQMQ
ncbi:PREDICTED: pickpocket protein 28-like [Rhagoletis zephyria]|uniref:pickpocket protein 28-like n=1 Tax=Rhagoletis zephyria TaxID=28612 RepID=UPI0008119D10|nr:PREDICTED: pickpocket protein 28-like [Rhagoletis zephyria]